MAIRPKLLSFIAIRMVATLRVYWRISITKRSNVKKARVIMRSVICGTY